MTSIKNKIESISEQIQDINKILNSFSNFTEIPQLDIDFLKDKFRIVYDNLININYLDSENKVILETIEGGVVVNQVIVDDENYEIALDDDDFDVSENEELTAKTDIEPEIVEEKVYEVSKMEIIDDKEEKEEIVVNEVVEIKKVNEIKNKIKNSNELVIKNKELKKIVSEFGNSSDLASKLKLNPISDINSAISINDKIGIIKDVFNGNAQEYSVLVQKINSFSNFNNAVNVLEEIKIWDESNTFHNKFIEIIYRRFL